MDFGIYLNLSGGPIAPFVLLEFCFTAHKSQVQTAIRIEMISVISFDSFNSKVKMRLSISMQTEHLKDPTTGETVTSLEDTEAQCQKTPL